MQSLAHRPMSTARVLIESSVLGMVVVVVALFAAFFASSDGVGVNTNEWPPAAKSVLEEHPEQPISEEQWARIRKTLHAHGGDATLMHTIAAEIRKVWEFPALVVVVALGLALWRWKRLTLATGALVVGPTAVLLVVAFAHTHPYLQ